MFYLIEEDECAISNIAIKLSRIEKSINPEIDIREERSGID